MKIYLASVAWIVLQYSPYDFILNLYMTCISYFNNDLGESSKSVGYLWPLARPPLIYSDANKMNAPVESQMWSKGRVKMQVLQPMLPVVHPAFSGGELMTR